MARGRKSRGNKNYRTMLTTAVVTGAVIGLVPVATWWIVGIAGGLFIFEFAKGM